jgi:exopolysaccharide production protein ExoZ
LGAATKLLTLQCARAVAANLVVLQHLNQFETRYAGGPIPFAQYGDFGVDLFFVLSGFVMVAVAGRNAGPLQFLWQRATRIYPTYWLASFIMLGIAAAVPGLVHKAFEPISMWRSFLLVADNTGPVVGGGWTLVHEMYFYVVFAIILASRLPALFAVTVWGLIITAASVLWPQSIMDSPILAVATSPLTFEFIMGVIVGVLWLKGRTPYAIIAGIVGIVALLGDIPVHYYLIAQMGPISVSPNYTIWRIFLFGLPMALIVYALVTYEHRTSAQPPALLVSIGDWSYSIYLFHFMVLSAIARAVLLAFPDRGLLASVILFIVGFVACNAAGAAVYFLFERPTLQMFRKNYIATPNGLRRLGNTASSSASLPT